MASHHPALWHGLDTLGAIAPGYQADLLLLPDLERFLPEIVLKRGRAVEEIPPTPVPEWVTQSVRVRPVAAEDFRVAVGGRPRARDRPRPRPDRHRGARRGAAGRGRAAVPIPTRDLAKIAVIERHLGTGRIGLGFVRGFGLERGAFASTFSHDAHNLVVVGVDDDDMARAVERLVELGGGLVVVDGGEVTAELPLPVAGLVSDRPLADVIEASEATVAAVHALGSEVDVAVPVARVPRPLGDPEPEDHRPRARRRRPLRARPARRGLARASLRPCRRLARGRHQGSALTDRDLLHHLRRVQRAEEAVAPAFVKRCVKTPVSVHGAEKPSGPPMTVTSCWTAPWKRHVNVVPRLSRIRSAP